MDKKTGHVTHLLSSYNVHFSEYPRVLLKDDPFLESIITSTQINVKRVTENKDSEWSSWFEKRDIAYVVSASFNSDAKWGSLIIPIRKACFRGAEKAIYEMIPKSHLESLKTYATIIGACVETEESHMTSQSAKRLVATIGHEVLGPVSVISSTALASVLEVLSIVEDLNERKLQAPEGLDFGKITDYLLVQERDIKDKAQQVAGIMKIAEDMAQETKGAGTLQLHFAKVDLFSIIKEAVGEVKMTLKHIDKSYREQKYIFRFNEACKNMPRVVGDKGLLQKVFVNVFTNAVKYSLPPGNFREIVIHVDANPQINQNIVLITNWGMAIHEDQNESIFRAFERGDTRDRLKARRGMGLSLYLARRIIAAHNGLIFLKQSSPTFDDPNRKQTEGWETIFEVRLPLGMKEGTFDHVI